MAKSTVESAPLKSGVDVTAQIEQLQREVASLRASFALFEGLATPRMTKLYQQAVGGLVAVASNTDWRMQGFYPAEDGSGATNVAWTQFDQAATIQMLLLKGETYSCALRLVQTPHIEAPGSVAVRVNGEDMAPTFDEDDGAYTFRYSARQTGWHAFSFNSRECFQPSVRGSKDRRRLGVLFRSLSIVPILP